MIIRPFFPGGDFEHYNYPNGCVVVDNPPFSMMAHILDYYQENHIQFFLFCDTRRQGTTALKRDGLTFICTNAKVVYENGAVVNTSFITNMTPDVAIRTAPLLKKKIESLSCGQSKPKRRLHHHPNTLTFARLARIATIDYELRRYDLVLYDKCSRIFKALFGAYGLLSDKKAAEVKAVVELAEEDYKLIEQLNNRDNHEHKDMSTY